MSPLLTYLRQRSLFKQAEFEGDFRRVISREGSIGVTTDRAGDRRGGATQAGVSQSYFGKNPDGSWKKSKAQIAALTPAEIKSVYADIYKVPNQFKDPGVREVMFDMTTNAGPGANKILQRSINRMVPNGRQLKVDSVVGPSTLAAAQGLDQRELTRNLLDGYSAHHQQLVERRPDLYATNKNGWANRVSDLRKRVLAPGPAPVSVNGRPPVFINNRRPPQSPTPSVSPTTAQPGGPIPSIPMLSAPSQHVMGKQAGHSLVAHLRRARNQTHTHPTPGQASAGNYRCGRFSFHGLPVAIENPKGTERRGYDEDGNVTWKRIMAEADYGFFPGTAAVDGDAVDVFVGPDLDSQFVVAVDQQNSDGSFDETKFIVAVTTQQQGERIYLSNYPKNWTLGPVATTTVQQLKTWLKEGDTKSPFKGQMVKAASLRLDKWERLCVRRGQCPTCGQSNCEGQVCGCGKTLSNDEWKARRDKLDAGEDLRVKSAEDSNWDGALTGAALSGALPAMSTAQYAGYDLPRYLRQADRLADTLPIVSSTSTKAIQKLQRPGRVVLQASAPVGLRKMLKSFMEQRSGEHKLKKFDAKSLRDVVNKNFSLAKRVWDDKFELGYGATATSGTPFRHAVMLDRKGQMLDGHATTGGSSAAAKAYDAAIARKMQGRAAQTAHSRSYANGVGSNTMWVQRWAQPTAFSLLGDFETPNLEKTMAAAYTNSASNYDAKGAKGVGTRHILAPRLPSGKASESAIQCRSGYCSRQAEDAFGLRNILGGKDALPGHLPLRNDFKPAAIVTEGLKGNKAEKILQLKELWRGGIKANATRRIGLGLGATLAAAIPGALLGGAADAVLGKSSPKGLGLQRVTQ